MKVPPDTSGTLRSRAFDFSDAHPIALCAPHMSDPTIPEPGVPITSASAIDPHDVDSKSASEMLDAADTMVPDELDRLPFGMIQLDRTGRILNYNAVESKLASMPREHALGKQFFTEIAPCTKVQQFYGRFKEGVIRETLDTSFRFHFAFLQSPRDVTVRLLYSKRTRTVWVLVSDHEVKPS